MALADSVLTADGRNSEGVFDFPMDIVPKLGGLATGDFISDEILDETLGSGEESSPDDGFDDSFW